uniref:Uncharacterized protein n=1 Tax=Chelydra serpentina TaxID=8475 RepID=A0A8C3XVV5_CHESE
ISGNLLWSEARLSQPRSHLSRAAAKSRCTTSKSAASSSKEVAGAGPGDKDRGSLLLRKPAGPLSPAKDTGKSFFMVPGERRPAPCACCDRCCVSWLAWFPAQRAQPAITARTPTSGGVPCLLRFRARQSSPPTRAQILCRGLWEW